MGLLSPKSQPHPANLREKQKHRKQNMGPADKMWPKTSGPPSVASEPGQSVFRSYVGSFHRCLNLSTSSSRSLVEMIKLTQHSRLANNQCGQILVNVRFSIIQTTLSFLITLAGAVNEPVHLPRLVLEAEASQVMLSQTYPGLR